MSNVIDTAIDEVADQIVEGIRKSVKDRGDRWRTYIKKADVQEKKFQNMMRKFFEKQRKQIVSNMRDLKQEAFSFDIDDVLPVITESIDDLNEDSFPMILAIIAAFGIDAISQTGADVEFNTDIIRIQEWSKLKSNTMSRVVNQTTYRQLRRELAAGLEAKEGYNAIVKRVSKVYDHAKIYRAEAIARTEVTGSSNFGTLEGYNQSNVVKAKEWLSQQDGRVRPTHMIDGETRLLGELFSNGLMFPGDPAGPVEEIMNCRCTLISVVEGA